MRSLTRLGLTSVGRFVYRVKQFPNIALPPQSWDAGSGKTQAAEAGQRQNGTERRQCLDAPHLIQGC